MKAIATAGSNTKQFVARITGVFMALSEIGDSHCEKRFHIECPVTVAIQARGKSSEFQGTLQEIWIGGARFYLDQPLAVDTRVILYVHFPDPTKKVATVRF